MTRAHVPDAGHGEGGPSVAREPPGRESALRLALVAPLAGLGVGLIGALFRLCLERANAFRNSVIGLGASSPLVAVLIVTAAALATAAAAWLVRRVAPSAAGSGIPRVMAVLSGNQPPAPARVVPVKFAAGTLAIGAGLSLGREGPSVQMGASVAYQVGRLLGLSQEDARTLLGAGAGAGFAVAFNAPIAGALFVFEGIAKRIDARTALAALAASAAAIVVGHAFTGDVPEYPAPGVVAPTLTDLGAFVPLGLAAGLVGVLYNRVVLGTTARAQRFAQLPVELRGALIGAAIAALGCAFPWLIGSGDALTRAALAGQGTLVLLPLVLVVRIFIIAVSVSAGTPGGLLVPFLSLGAELGLWLALVCHELAPGLCVQPVAFSLVGMAAIFTAIVRTPMTAIVLVVELSSTRALLLPMLSACFVAMLVPTLTGDPPILDVLRGRAYASSSSNAPNTRSPL